MHAVIGQGARRTTRLAKLGHETGSPIIRDLPNCLRVHLEVSFAFRELAARPGFFLEHRRRQQHYPRLARLQIVEQPIQLLLEFDQTRLPGK